MHKFSQWSERVRIPVRMRKALLRSRVAPLLTDFNFDALENPQSFLLDRHARALRCCFSSLSTAVSGLALHSTARTRWLTGLSKSAMLRCERFSKGRSITDLLARWLDSTAKRRGRSLWFRSHLEDKHCTKGYRFYYIIHCYSLIIHRNATNYFEGFGHMIDNENTFHF